MPISLSRRWLTLSGLALPVAFTVVGAILLLRGWFEVPRRVRILAADKKSVYYQFGGHLKEAMERRGLARTIEVESGTRGSIQNAKGLRDGLAQLGLIQDGAFSKDSSIEATAAESELGSVQIGKDVMLLAPVFPEVVHVLVRREQSGAGAATDGNDIRDGTANRLRKLLLADDSLIYKGSADFSGMQKSAAAILEHYAIALDDVNEGGKHPETVENAFWGEPAGSNVEASDVGNFHDGQPKVAIVTTSITNKKLRAVLRGTDYEFLPVECDALSITHPYFHPHVIPKGTYGHRDDGQAVPSRDIQTVATTAFLAVPADANSGFVTEMLDTLYKEGLRTKQPDLIPRDQVNDYLHMPFHPAARAYFDPYDFGPLASMVETLSGSKEIIFAIGAGVYLLWTLRRRRRERIRQGEMDTQIARLDEFLDRTIALEAAQMDTRDLQRLRRILNDATQLKLDALDELTDKDLRGDRRFSIFLMQCTSLIDKIQLKIITYATEASSQSRETGDCSRQEGSGE